MGQVNTELGQSATAVIALNDANVRTLAGIPTGAISMGNLQGKTSSFSFTLASGTDVNLRTQAIAAGWPQSAPVIATIDAGSTIQASSTGTAALTISGLFPGGVSLTNGGTIIGRGGNAGAGGFNAGPLNNTASNPGGAGGAGGLALLVSSAVSIDNANGRVSGGGSGGGGGGGGQKPPLSAQAAAGGGGGGGIGVSLGGAPNGGAGTLIAVGAGGAGSVGPLCRGGNGGTGGSYGSAGTSGNPGSNNSGAGTRNGAGGAAGAAGGCTSGNVNITWTSVGIRDGALN